MRGPGNSNRNGDHRFHIFDSEQRRTARRRSHEWHLCGPGIAKIVCWQPTELEPAIPPAREMAMLNQPIEYLSCRPRGLVTQLALEFPDRRRMAAHNGVPEVSKRIELFRRWTSVHATQCVCCRMVLSRG